MSAGLQKNDAGVRRDQIDFSTIWSSQFLRALSVCCRSPPARLFGFPVNAHAAGTENDDVEEPTGHRQVLVEMDHVGSIADRQMHAEGGAQTEKNEQRGSPPRLEAGQQRQTADEMDRNGDPDGNVGNRYVYAGKILDCAGGISGLHDAVPDK